jgi:hypothetical protein
MKSENLLTNDELKALLTHEEREQLRTEHIPTRAEAGYEDTGHEETPAAATVSLDQASLAEMLQTISALTLRVEALEQSLQEQTAQLDNAAAMAPPVIADTPAIPEPGSFSRSESYGRNRKKKKSMLQKLLD